MTDKAPDLPRYKLDRSAAGYHDQMLRRAGGAWVKYSDAATALESAQARIAEVEAVRIRLLNEKLSGEWREEVEQTASAEALEEADKAVHAALVRDPRHDSARHAAKAAIRALKEKPNG